MRLRKHLILINTCIATSILIVLLLLGISRAASFKKGGFLRSIQLQAVSLLEAYDLKDQSYYIAGVTDNNIFLGNQKITSKIIILGHDLRNVRQINLDISPYKISWQGARIKIDSPYVSISESITPAIMHGFFDPFRIVPYKIDSIYYSQALPISFSTYILKVYDRSLKRDILIKKDKESPYIVSAKEVLEKQIDGRFCEDGMLLYSSDSRRIVYIYYYRNEFICLDTSLNIIYKKNTIDTNRFAKIKIGRINSENSITLSTPHLVVNKKSCIAGNHLFINSGKFAENEDKKEFYTSSVIDVYALDDGHYKFSFYLPDIHYSKIVSFTIYKNRLIATYDNHYVAVFQINFTNQL